MKYVLFETPGSADYPVVFPEFLDHSFMVRAIQGQHPGVKPVSAGYCSRHGSVWGESLTLQLKSRAQDCFYLNQLLDIDNLPPTSGLPTVQL